jgi:hypothetical protein
MAHQCTQEEQPQAALLVQLLLENTTLPSVSMCPPSGCMGLQLHGVQFVRSHGASFSGAAQSVRSCICEVLLGVCGGFTLVEGHLRLKIKNMLAKI